jgi:Ribbon-helix-helix protein, copG family
MGFHRVDVLRGTSVVFLCIRLVPRMALVPHFLDRTLQSHSVGQFCRTDRIPCRAFRGSRKHPMATQEGDIKIVREIVKRPLQNLIAFAPFDGLPPLHRVDKKMMIRLRELADRRGSSVENRIREVLEQWVLSATPSGN